MAWTATKFVVKLHLFLQCEIDKTDTVLTGFVNTQFIHVPTVYIRIHYSCEGGIEKSVPRITDWHHAKCRVSEDTV